VFVKKRRAALIHGHGARLSSLWIFNTFIV
jgi:hypothetical protein